MTANSLIAAALRLIGVIRTGQTASPSEIADSLDGLNNLIDNWNTERLNILSIGSASYPLVSATASYSIGTGQTFNAPRPVKIETAFIRVPNTGGLGPDANIDFKLDLMSEADYDGIKDKGSYSEIPRSLYNDRAVPYSTLYCFPTPVFTSAITVSLVLHVWNVLAAFPDLVTDIPLGPGYTRALEYNLALEMAPRFDKQAADLVADTAGQAKAAIRALNGAPPPAEPTAAPVNATLAAAPPAKGN